MNATDLQKLKELAQVTQRAFLKENQYDYEVSKEFHDFCNAATPAAILELIALAERAVSPAESVQSVDETELRKLLDSWFLADESKQAEQAAEDAIVAHINAKIAAAHAEGRRSAMEELAKEKERADKAEADAALLAKRYSDALNAAARQVPDIGHLPCYTLNDGRLIPVGIVKSIIDRGDMMLSLLDVRTALLAQPLQQEGGFDFHAHLARQAKFSAETFGPGMRTAGVCDHIRKELKEIEADPSDLAEWIDVVILALDGAWRCGGSPSQIIDGIVAKQTKNEGRKWPDWRTADPNKAIEHDRSADAPQPSDNLQQASTAQVEPMEDPVTVPRGLLGAACYAIERKKDAPTVLAKLREFTTGARSGYRATPAQATPEGADLPPMKGIIESIDGEEFRKLADAYHCVNKQEDVEPTYDALFQYIDKEIERQAIAYARAALAAQQNSSSNSSNNSATTAAEPVGEIVGFDSSYATVGLYDVGHVSVGDLVYRAAPPQQVDTGGLPG